MSGGGGEEGGGCMGRLKGGEGCVFKCFHLDSFNPGRILILGDVYPIPDL